CLQGHIIPFTF
nr:immunoglobulin light chain junction region [Macaca mulatta]MOX99962.1 immunoglobulin light chain junction region [Macaca mulatta]MOY00571.1 immunoglobulin light chain junction region [Macaca mulatta]MOY04663.1 immunoglobulin light chain junction region [Macaca mulatta]